MLAGGDDQFAEMTASLEARRATVAQSESAFAESRKTMVAEVTDFDRRKSTAKPRNPRHFETLEGGRDGVPDTFCT